MISQNEIMKLVKEYAKSPEGKAEIKRVYGIDYDEKFTKTTARIYGERMKRILFTHISEKIKSFDIKDIIVSDVIDNNGKYSIAISFSEESLKRKSLRPDLYPDGLENIVLLFAHGYRTGHPIYGTWEKPSGNIDVWGKRSREPSSFLQDAVAEFNAMAKGIAFAALEEKYD